MSWVLGLSPDSVCLGCYNQLSVSGVWNEGEAVTWWGGLESWAVADQGSPCEPGKVFELDPLRVRGGRVLQGRASLAGYQAGTCHGSSKVHCPCSLSAGAHALFPYFHSSRRLFTQGIVTSSREQAEQQILKGNLCFAQSVACRVGGKKLDMEIFGTLGTNSVFRMLLQGIWASSSCLITSCVFLWKMPRSQQVWGCATPTNSEDAIPSP